MKTYGKRKLVCDARRGDVLLQAGLAMPTYPTLCSTAVNSMVHPDTGETIPAPYRMSFFVPANVPICVGMVLSGGGVCAQSEVVSAGSLQRPTSAHTRTRAALCKLPACSTTVLAVGKPDLQCGHELCQPECQR